MAVETWQTKAWRTAKDHAKTYAANWAKDKVREYINKPYRNPKPTKPPKREPKYHRVMKKPYTGSNKPARHVGKFKKPKKRPEANAKYAVQGAAATMEVSGRVSDDQCVYITHASHSAYVTLRTVVLGLLRHLLKKGFGWNASDVYEVIPAYYAATYNQSTSLQISISTINRVDSAVINDAFILDVPNDCNIMSLCGSLITIGGSLWNGVLNTGTQDPGFTMLYWLLLQAQNGIVRPHQITLYRTGASGAPYDVLCVLDFSCLKAHVKSVSTLKVQNRSIPELGDDEADNVDNVPLCGKTFDFKHYSPRCHEQARFNCVNTETGMQLIRAGQLLGSSQSSIGFQEPPARAIFQNCSGSAKIQMNPGELKTDALTFIKSANFTKLFDSMTFKTLTLASGTGFTNSFSIGLGTCRMLALEKFINIKAFSSTELPIDVVYENNVWCGAYVTHKSKRAMLNSFDVGVLSNTVT